MYRYILRESCSQFDSRPKHLCITDAQWAEAINFVEQYAFALNGGAGGGRLGLGADQVRISVVHWADNGQQSMGIPFRQCDHIKSFINRLRGLQRQYIGLACPGVVMKWAVMYAICNVNELMCAKRMLTSAIVHATQSAVTPPLMESTIGIIEGISPDSGTVATADVLLTDVMTKDVQTLDPYVQTYDTDVIPTDDTFIMKASSLARRRAQELVKSSLTYVDGSDLYTERTALYSSLTVASKCCVSCFDGKACGDSCIDADMECKIVGGCACNAVPTANTLYKAGTYVLSKQGLAAVRTPPTTGGTTSSGGQYTSCGCIPIADPTNCILFMTDLSLDTLRSPTCESACEMRPDKYVTECGYTYGEYSAELGYRSNANGGATVVVIATDGNPAPAAECSTSDAGRMAYIQFIKQHADRIVPVGIGSHVDVGTLLTLSKGMPEAMPYVTTSFGSLSSALDILATLSCPTQVRCSFLLFALYSFVCSFFCLLIFSSCAPLFFSLPNAGADGASDRRADE